MVSGDPLLRRCPGASPRFPLTFADRSLSGGTGCHRIAQKYPFEAMISFGDVYMKVTKIPLLLSFAILCSAAVGQTQVPSWDKLQAAYADSGKAPVVTGTPKDVPKAFTLRISFPSADGSTARGVFMNGPRKRAVQPGQSRPRCGLPHRSRLPEFFVRSSPN